MPQQPFEPTAPDRRPRHGAGADERTPVEGAWAQLPSGEWARTTPHRRSESREEWAARLPELPGWAQETTGRHRRPESLADSTRLRPVTERASGHSRSAEGRFELGEYEDSFIERGYPDDNRPAGPAEVGTGRRSTIDRQPSGPGNDGRRDIEREPARAGRRRAAEPEAAERTEPIVRQSGRRRTIRRTAADKPEKGRGRRAAAPEAAEYSRDLSDTDSHRRPAVDEMHDRDHADARRRPSGGRGRHAARADDRAITVRGLPVVPNGVEEEGPKRAREPIRDWALYTGDKPGSHRAPGTLPIESWLLVGRKRQQILLGTLVAAGLALVTIPIQQHASINPLTTANHLIAQGGGSAHRAPVVKDPVKPGVGQRQTTGKLATAPPSQPAGPQPATANPPAATTAPATDPLVPVPQGSGPAHSLRVTGSNAISLTFDDGPDPVQTPKILAMLDKYQIKATFCLIGTHVEKHPEIVRDIVAAGHTLCNHTWNHSLTIGTESPAAIQADLDRTTAAIHAAAPGAPIPFFRAPGGNFTDRLVSVAYQQGMTSLYWQVDPRDWDHTTDADDLTHTDRVIASVQKFVKPGSIILSHDFNQPDTVLAYEKLMPWLKANFEIGLPVPPPMAPATAKPVTTEPATTEPATTGSATTGSAKVDTEASAAPSPSE